MTRFKNDTSKTRLGDQYQYLIALECCINAESEDDIIYIEQRGDVATKDVSTEVKHHGNKNHKISDRHVDIWKTLKNLVENYDVISSYKKLVLLTTSNFSEKSKLIDWNVLTKEEKLEQLTKIKNGNVTKTIKKFVEVVFKFENGHTEDRLLDILDKFCISHNQPIINEKVQRLLTHPFFTIIPRRNRKSFLDLLLGYILSAGQQDAADWVIKKSEFNTYVEYYGNNYTSKTLPIPDSYRHATADVASFSDYNFVKEIRKIDLSKEIQNAVNDYYRTQKTVIEIENNDAYFAESFSYYQDNVISTDLRNIKSKCELEIIDKNNAAHKIKQSKRTYYDAMAMETKQIKGYMDNHDFFQRGTIHTIVDSTENDFCWHFD